MDADEDLQNIVRDNVDEEDEEDMGEPVGPASDDSSEEPEEDEEELHRVRDGFIVDEEEESADETERRRRKKKRRTTEKPEDDVLEEDDLELLEENTGRRVERQRLTRIRRVRDSQSPAEESGRFGYLDDDNDEPEKEIERIWEDNVRGGGIDGLDDDDMDMDDFIDDDDQDEGMAEEEREERRRERKRLEKERHKALGARPDLTGIDAVAWDEIYEVFGDGTDYDWALEDEDTLAEEEEITKDLKFADVFEPSEIKARMLTDEDDVIRLQDKPERMQLASATISSAAIPAAESPLVEGDLDDAAHWITLRLSERHEKDYFRPDGQLHEYLSDLITCVRRVIEYLFIEFFEVPYIWTHRRDYISLFDPDRPTFRLEHFRRDDLWKIYTLGRKYQALLERRKALDLAYERLQVSDDYFESKIKEELDSVESVADATEWIGLKYRSRRKDEELLRFHDDEDVEQKKRKLPNRISDYELVKKSVISKLANDFGLKSHEIVMNYRAAGSSTKEYFVEDQDFIPRVHAEAFGDPNGEQQSEPAQLLQQARMLLATELGKDPLLRKDIRQRFKLDGVVTVSPTEKGISKIDEHHPYNQFKYLRGKPVRMLLDSPQFLHILAAESEHLVTMEIDLIPESRHELTSLLIESFHSDNYSDSAKAWNDERTEVIQEAIDKHLIPTGVRWIREWICDEAQSNLARKCGDILRNKISSIGYKASSSQQFARVVGVTWGKGDPQKDVITVVYLDENGTLRDNFVVDNLRDDENKEKFKDLVFRREPQVVVVGGLSISTTTLVSSIKTLVHSATNDDFQFGSGRAGEVSDRRSEIEVVYGFDEVARMYQHSKRANSEFSALSLPAKYCVGVARYIQSPICEYAALGEDLVALTLDDEFQHLIPKEKLLLSLERTLVDVVNEIGVDINRAVTDPYYKHLLPFISGLGPRKAQNVIKKVATLGGNLVNRMQFIRGEIMTTRIFENAAGFLRINQSGEFRMERNRNQDESELPDPLDATRVHPEDYELARKMAADALDLDEEDIQDEHPSYVVNQIMQAKDGERRLDELNLDDFAVNMFRTNQDRKRHILNTIKAELLDPFKDHRKEYVLPTDWDVLTMLTSETLRTLRIGLIISVVVARIRQNYVVVRLDSGLEGVINTQYLADQPPLTPDAVVKKGQTILGVIIDVRMDLAGDKFGLELSSRPADVAVGDANFRKVPMDEDYYDTKRAASDQELLQRKKRSENNQARRVIKHPNFHNFNSVQAESYLTKQQRGDAIVRPSSKGVDHLAVTWKVDDGVFQHIDVVEPNADVTQQTTGNSLFVEGTEYADLDELIVNHVQTLARRVEEIMAHEKYKRGSDENTRRELEDYVAANPNKSVYCFTLDRKRPGHFNLVFKANSSSPIQSWPVRVTRNGYRLNKSEVPTVLELCDAFKYQVLQSSFGASSGAKTPYGGRTPARMTPGHRTPGRMSVRQAPATGRTPNPYASYGGATPRAAAPSLSAQRPVVPGLSGGNNGWGR